MLAQLPVQGKTVTLRRAAAEDVPAIVRLLAADQLGATRDGVTTDEDLQPYLHAFDAIDADPAHLLLVAADGAQVLATMQLSFLPGLARRGALRAQIEAVRVRDDHLEPESQRLSAAPSRSPGFSTRQRRSVEERLVGLTSILVDLRLPGPVAEVGAVTLGAGEPEPLVRGDVVEVGVETLEPPQLPAVEASSLPGLVEVDPADPRRPAVSVVAGLQLHEHEAPCHVRTVAPGC